MPFPILRATRQPSRCREDRLWTPHPSSWVSGPVLVCLLTAVAEMLAVESKPILSFGQAGLYEGQETALLLGLLLLLWSGSDLAFGMLLEEDVRQSGLTVAVGVETVV